VPRKPDWSQHADDERFASYRDRVARLYRGDDEVGLLLVRVQPYARLVSGHLWWRRWVAEDVLRLRTTIGGKQEDHVVHGDLVVSELRDYRRGVFRYRGEALRLAWTSPEESARLREAELGA
jgi:hypothetical protein